MRRYIIYRYWNLKANHLDFLETLQAAWLEDGNKQDVVASNSAKKHNHVFLKEVHTKRQPRCKWCTAYLGALGARRTWWYCEECNVPLCQSGTCFSNYHDEVKLYNAVNTKSGTKESRRKRKRSNK